MREKYRKGIIAALLLVFLGALFFLTFNRHSRAGIYNYHSEIWGDKAGYYVYLPATFIYHFQPDSFPDHIRENTGYGFSLDSGLVSTKYPCGVAIMLSPFFLTGHFYVMLTGGPADGFSIVYHKIIDIAAVLYAFFALIILYKFLQHYFTSRIALLTTGCLFVGTNVIYYALFETGMSHIYSFFLFSSFLYLSEYVVRPNGRISHFLLLGLVAGLIIVVRPVNILFLPVFFLFHKIEWAVVCRNGGKWLLVMLAAGIVIIPQLLYWKYISGHYLYDSYHGESFTNIWSPKLFHLWFSTHNGLFTYNPIILVILAGFFYFYRIHPKQTLWMAGYMLFISLVFASWHDWRYGCAFGSRPYVEYYTLLALPMGCFIRALGQRFSGKTLFVTIIMVIFISYNLKMMFSFDGCWYGGEWDWQGLWRQLVSPT